MKKVGILTMHAVRNYGSFLQAYATQKRVEELGYEAMLIDYQYPNALHGSKPSLKSRLLHSANVAAKSLLPGNPNRRLNQRWQEAYDTYYHLTPRYPDRDSLRADPPECDILLIGSDQVWNERFIKGDDTFFGAFAPPAVKRIAYASSFGSLEVSDTAFYREQLSGLSDIAVREPSGAELVRWITGREDTEQVCDPTLLLPASYWKTLTHPAFVPERPYILCYGSNHRDFMFQTAKLIADEHGWEVCCCNGNILDYRKKDRRTLLDVGPLEWLWLIRNAALVMACSFHGTVFSIQFNTSFLAVCTGNPSFDSRLDSLLSAFHLEANRLEVGAPCKDQLKDIFHTDWPTVNAAIEVERNRSAGILSRMLSE